MDRKIGYNLTEGGDGTFGRMHSEETKEKIRQKAIGRKASDETKKKMSEIRKGKCSEKQREHLKELSRKTKGKRVFQYSASLEFIAEYECICDAVKSTGICKDTITRQLKKPVTKITKNIKYIWLSEKLEKAAMAA